MGAGIEPFRKELNDPVANPNLDVGRLLAEIVEAAFPFPGLRRFKLHAWE
jgi:hypothetical protein